MSLALRARWRGAGTPVGAAVEPKEPFFSLFTSGLRTVCKGALGGRSKVTDGRLVMPIACVRRAAGRRGL
jgi:hypothetical protein